MKLVDAHICYMQFFFYEVKRSSAFNSVWSLAKLPTSTIELNTTIDLTVSWTDLIPTSKSSCDDNIYRRVCVTNSVG